jgi:hypothetical protein
MGLCLNRANDGFVYFPDGSYSLGPTSAFLDLDYGKFSPSINQEQGESNSAPEILACLCFGSTRFVVSLDSDDEAERKQEKAVCLQTRPSSSTVPRLIEQIQIGAQNGDDPNSSLGTLPFGYRINSEIQCRMLSSNQPWMLQRAQWEQLRGATPEEQRELLESPTEGSGSTRANIHVASADADDPDAEDRVWQARLTLSDYDRRFGAELGPSFASSLEPGCKILQVGAAHRGAVKILSRIYSPRGGVELVRWSEGVRTYSQR